MYSVSIIVIFYFLYLKISGDDEKLIKYGTILFFSILVFSSFLFVMFKIRSTLFINFFTICTILLLSSSFLWFSYTTAAGRYFSAITPYYAALQRSINIAERRFAPRTTEHMKRPRLPFLVLMASSLRREFGTDFGYDAQWLKYKDRYHDINDVIETKILPFPPQIYEAPFKKINNIESTPYFGIKWGLIKDFDGDELPEIIASSYTSRVHDCTNEPCQVSLIPSSRIVNGSRFVIADATETGTINWGDFKNDLKYLADDVPRHKFGSGTGDVNGDGRGDLIIGRSVVLTDHGIARGNLEQILLAGRVNRNHTFASTPAFVSGPEFDLVAFAETNSRVAVVDLNRAATGKSARSIIEIGSNHGSISYPDLLGVVGLGDWNGDGFGELFIRTDKAIVIVWSKNGYAETRKTVILLSEDLSSVAGFTLMVGGIGDYDGDGATDFWITSFQAGNRNEGRAYLILGKDIAPDGVEKNLYLDKIVALTIRGNSDVGLRSHTSDGIGTELSLVAGDFDNDGIPDFSIAAHKHLDFAGALYILTGKTIRKLLGKRETVDILGCRISRFRGNMASMLAPRGVHYADNFDFNKDGYSDILIASDTDNTAAPSAGALYLLDGKKISSFLETACPVE